MFHKNGVTKAKLEKRNLVEEVVGAGRLDLGQDPPVPLPQLRLHARNELRAAAAAAASVAWRRGLQVESLRELIRQPLSRGAAPVLWRGAGGSPRCD